MDRELLQLQTQLNANIAKFDKLERDRKDKILRLALADAFRASGVTGDTRLRVAVSAALGLGLANVDDTDEPRWQDGELEAGVKQWLKSEGACFVDRPGAQENGTARPSSTSLTDLRDRVGNALLSHLGGGTTVQSIMTRDALGEALVHNL